ncbi:MAG: SRPBCC domain-containing protein [Pseudomonadota bacterium]
MSDFSITKTIFLNASRETVWAFLTEKEKLGHWFHPADADLAEGRDYALISGKEGDEPVKQCWGTVLEMQPPSRLRYSFTVKPLKGAMTDVVWTLESVPGGTKLTLVHSGLEVAGEGAFMLSSALDVGWDKHLGALRDAMK